MFDWKDIVGKTVKKVNTKNINIVILSFTDGTSMAIDTEAVGYGLYTPVLYDAADYKPKKKKKEKS